LQRADLSSSERLLDQRIRTGDRVTKEAFGLLAARHLRHFVPCPFAIVVTHDAARMERLPARPAIERDVDLRAAWSFDRGWQTPGHAAAVKWYELRWISQGRAAEIAGVPRTEFIDALSRYEVSPFQETMADLSEAFGENP
jgi:hypothetical protein